MANIITVLVEHDNINYYKDKLNDIDREIVLKALGEDIAAIYTQYDNNVINVQPNMSDISSTSDSYILGFERPNELVEIAEEWNSELRDNAVRHLEELEALAQNTTSSQSNEELNDSIDEYEFSSLAQNTTSSQSSEEPNDSTNKYEFGSLAQNHTAPIQDEYGVLRFSLDGKDYCFNVNSEKERRRVKEEINANSLVQYDWFDEETGEEHWVLYNTEMYEIKDFHLHYKEGSLLAPVIPINATSCYAMFRDCSHLPTLNFSDFDTSNVVDMDYMFARCSNFITLDLSGFNTSKVTEMRSMFEHCTALLYLDLSRFDTSKVTDMNSMFYRCSNATFIDVANFDTSNVIDMSNMFAYCKLLIKLNLCKFDTSNVASSENMFYYCELLETIYVSYKWNLNIYPCPRAGL